MTYALLVDGMDGEQREKFDRQLNGWDERDKRVLADLFGVRPDSGGES